MRNKVSFWRLGSKGNRILNILEELIYTDHNLREEKLEE